MKKATKTMHGKRPVCGTMKVHHRLLDSNPDYVAARARCEHECHVRMLSRETARTGVTVIPVVVHVVYKAAAENISDEQIQSQINVLNQDFRATNGDLSAAPSVFRAVSEDARLEFVLADTDPDGNPTTGIVRVNTSKASFSDDDGVKFASSGGSDAWPAADYLNIWVCNLQPYLGYAQFPGGPAETDGVVILHSAFGTIGTAQVPFNLGRTTTHEIGHWLNLRHIWGDDGDGCFGSDFVNDTPNQAGPNYGKPGFPSISCGNAPNGDMYVNYMDYVDDDSMVMFTHDQVGRMQAALDSDRSTIGTTKPGPSLKFADDPQTLKFLDDPGSLKFSDDPQTLKFSDDPQTLKFLDDPGTLKFRDDPQTLKFVDDPNTFKFSDDPGSLKFRDDPIKNPTSDQIGGLHPFGTLPPFGPDFGQRPEGAVPFILSTPHHSTAWTRSYPAAYQHQVADLDEAINQYAQTLGEMQAAADRLTPQEQEQGKALYEEYLALVQQRSAMQSGGAR